MEKRNVGRNLAEAGDAVVQAWPFASSPAWLPLNPAALRLEIEVGGAMMRADRLGEVCEEVVHGMAGQR